MNIDAIRSLGRIAEALERIADILEEDNEEIIDQEWSMQEA